VILTDHFVWMHIPKTGGTWFRETLKKEMPPSWNAQVIYPCHWFAEDLKNKWPNYVDKPRFCFVRNPWDWWVSLWHFWKGHYQNRTGGFALPKSDWSKAERVWDGLLDPSGELRIQTLEQLLFAYPASTLSEYYSKVAGDSDCVVGRFENLRSDAIRLLEVHCEVPKSLKRALETAPAVNESVHSPYRVFYSQRAQKQVSILERPLIEQFGYVF